MPAVLLQFSTHQFDNTHLKYGTNGECGKESVTFHRTMVAFINFLHYWVWFVLFSYLQYFTAKLYSFNERGISLSYITVNKRVRLTCLSFVEPKIKKQTNILYILYNIYLNKN